MKYLMIITFFLLATTIQAQKIGNFTLSNAANDKSVSLSDYSSSNAVVIIFTSNVCPYSIYYEGRITQLIGEFKGDNVQFVLINSHQEEKESVEEMANKISAWGLKVPYLADKDQVAMKALGARKSPEAFVLKPTNGSFSIYYKGAIDNNPQVASDVKNRFLRDNINNLLQGKQAQQGRLPIGCMIK